MSQWKLGRNSLNILAVRIRYVWPFIYFIMHNTKVLCTLMGIERETGEIGKGEGGFQESLEKAGGIWVMCLPRRRLTFIIVESIFSFNRSKAKTL